MLGAFLHDHTSVIFFLDNSSLECRENEARNLESIWKFFLSKDLMIGHENLKENVAPKGSGKFWKIDEYIKMHQKGKLEVCRYLCKFMLLVYIR